MPMIGANGGLIGSARTSRRGAAVGLWTPNEQVIYQRQNAWIGDASFDSVSLLLHMDGSNGSTTFTDSSKNALTVTANGNAQISTAQSKFGGASAVFDGTGDYLSITGTTNTLLSTVDFCVEFWLRVAGAGDDNGCHVVQSRNGTNNGIVIIYERTLQRLTAASESGGLSLASANSSIADNTWYHVALTRSSTTFRLFIDGVSVANQTPASLDLQANNWIVSRRFASDGSFHYLNGYIDDLRITKGVARYTANFTPPSAPFPDV